MKNTPEMLKERYQQNKLANLYLVNPNNNLDTETIQTWSEKLAQTITGVGHNHDDILILGINSETGNISESDYVLDDFKELERWVNYSPRELNSKIVIIHNADRISKTIYNKHLKMFEEPVTQTSFILLNPRKIKLIDTIESRAIKLRPIIENQVDQNKINEVLSDVKELEFNDFYAKYKNEFHLIERALETKEIIQYQQASNLINIYKQSEIKKQFNNYAAACFYNSYSLLK